MTKLYTIQVCKNGHIRILLRLIHYKNLEKCHIINQYIYSRVAYIYVRSRAKHLKFRTTTSKCNTLRKPLMQQKYYFIHEM